jgi:hypothetical protein
MADTNRGGAMNCDDDIAGWVILSLAAVGVLISFGTHGTTEKKIALEQVDAKPLH